MQQSKWSTNPIKSRFSPSYYDNGILDQFDNLLEAQILRHCLEDFGEKISCLDLAAGNGRFSEVMLPFAKNLDIVDLEQKHLDFMKARFGEPNTNLYLDDALGFLKRTTNTYDVIVISGLLLFFNAEQAKLLIDCARIRLNANGTIFVRDFISKESDLTVPYEHSPNTLLYYRPKAFYDNLGAYSYAVCRPYHRFIDFEKFLFGLLGFKIYKLLCSTPYLSLTWFRMPWLNFIFLLKKREN